MQVQNNVSSNQFVSTEKSVELKKDDIIDVKIKEMKNNGEAIVQYRGKEIQAKFEGEPPKGSNATVQVLGEKDGVLQLKTVQQENEKTTGQENNTKSNLQNLGVTDKDSEELKGTVNELLKKGVSLTKETVDQLRTFLKSENGTMQQKMETVNALTNKNLEITQQNLESVHSALHGKNLGQLLNDVAGEIRNLEGFDRSIENAVREILRQVNNGADINKALEQIRSLIKNKNISSSQIKQFEKSLSEINQLQQLGKNDIASKWLQQSLTNVVEDPDLNEMLQLIMKATEKITSTNGNSENSTARQIQQINASVQKEGNFNTAIELAKNGLSSLDLSVDFKNKIDASLKQMEELNNRGRELKARQEMALLLQMVENEVNTQAPINSSESQIYAANEAFQTSAQLSTKEFIVTKISQNLAEMMASFREMKRELIRNLNNVQQIIEQNQVQARPQAKQLLEATIKRLDDTILKSDVMLYTDMKTEKQLIQASGELAHAKKLLAKGDYQGAHKITSEVKALVEKMNFQPSDTKVMRFITKELQMQDSRVPSQQLLNQINDLTNKGIPKGEASARQMFEIIRALGLNHESETGKSILSQQGNQNQSGGQSNYQQHQQNMKALLMQMMKDGTDFSGRSVEQILQNLTGQQLLSKADTNNNTQSMMFNIPLVLEDQVNDLQVFVKSKNQGEQVDWENCSLYFLIETKKLGEVGIMLSSTDRNLAITVRNDKDNLKERIAPIADQTKERLKELGYSVNSIQFSKLQTKQAEEPKKKIQEQQPFIPTFNSKGMDFKI